MEKKSSLVPENYVTVSSKFGFFEVFNDKNIKKGFHSINNHILDKKYEDKIPFPVIETILMDNGQFLFWNFTDKQGYVMRKSSKKLTKDSILLHLINLITGYFTYQERINFQKSDNQIMGDLNRITPLIDQNISRDKLFKDADIKYLEKLIYHKFILLYLNGYESEPRNVNLLEFNKTMNDSNLISLISMIQINLNVIKKVKPLICKYIKKSDLAPKKIQIFIEESNQNENKQSKILIETRSLTRSPTRIKFFNEGENSQHPTDTQKLFHIIDQNLANYLDKILEPFIKLIEKSKRINIREGHFKFIKIRDDLFDEPLNKEGKKIKSLSEHYVFAYCSKILAEKGTNEFQLEKLKKMEKINIKGVPKELVKGPKKLVKPYEKITKDATCFGEFCDFEIPKYFKNLKKKNSNVDEINCSKVPIENKFSERDKMHNLPNSLPVFIIKKTYDNPQLVNIALKAYSIFPKGFDKDFAIKEMNRIKKEDEEIRKIEEKELIKKYEDEKRKLHSEMNNDDLPTISNIHTINTFELSKKHESNNITLYKPTPEKFDRINFDFMYTKKSVCKNCYIIYNLIQNFLNNIDGTTSQFISLSKAKQLLLQGDQIKNGNEKDDSISKDLPENILFQEERNDFNLKSILMKNLYKMKKEEMKKKEKRREKLKLYKKNVDKREEFQKTFSYNMHANPKLLKLNLVAEKTKNKFFNLIFNELRSEPESIYSRLGIKKPDRIFKKSMNNLRLHMGINSYSYNANFNKMNEMSKNVNDEVLKDLISGNNTVKLPESTREEAIRKTIKSKNMNVLQIKSFRKALQGREMVNTQTGEINQVDVDIFSSYRNIKKTQSGDNNISAALNKQAEKNEKIEKVEKIEKPEKAEKIDKYSLRYNYLLEEDNDDITVSGEESEIEEDEEVIYDYDENDSDSYYLTDVNMSMDMDMNINQDEDQKYQKNHGEKNNIPVIEDKYNNKLKKSNSYVTLKSPINFQFDKYIFNRSKSSYIKKENKNLDLKNKFTTKTTNKNIYNVKKPPSTKNMIITQHSNPTLTYIRADNRTHTNPTLNNYNQTHITTFSNHTYELNKKIAVTSIFYYDWAKNHSKFDSDYNYYFRSTPLTKFNELNMPVTENPLILSQSMNSLDFIKIGKFENSPLLDQCNIFVYDQFTAIPYKVVTLKNEESEVNAKKEASYISILKKGIFARKISMPVIKDTKGKNCLVVVLNDFFESYIKYEHFISDIWKDHLENLEKLKILFFNFPGQSTTLFSKNDIFNNFYYAEFLDRFLFYLSEKQEFDNSFNIILLGFGNGAHVALAYTSIYEKYWDFIHSIILFNSYCENDEFINKSMLEILKIIESSRNHKLVNFYIKSISLNPQKLVNVDNEIESTNINSFSRPNTFFGGVDNNPITMTGYHSITRGYFFNLKINYNEIQVPLIVVHSNQNCFITINNINNIFNFNKSYPASSKSNIFKKEDNSSSYRRSESVSPQLNDNFLFEEILPINKIRRKLIVVHGSHDILSDNPKYVSGVINSFLKFINKKMPIGGKFSI